MTPTFTKINDNALQPYLNETISREQAMSAAEKPLRDFMFAQVSQSDLELFYSLTKKEKPKSLDEWSQMFHIHNFHRHDALADALVTAQLFLILQYRALETGISSGQDLVEAARQQEWLWKLRRRGL